ARGPGSVPALRVLSVRGSSFGPRICAVGADGLMQAARVPQLRLALGTQVGRNLIAGVRDEAVLEGLDASLRRGALTRDRHRDAMAGDHEDTASSSSAYSFNLRASTSN